MSRLCSLRGVSRVVAGLRRYANRRRPTNVTRRPSRVHPTPHRRHRSPHRAVRFSSSGGYGWWWWRRGTPWALEESLSDEGAALIDVIAGRPGVTYRTDSPPAAPSRGRPTTPRMRLPHASVGVGRRRGGSFWQLPHCPSSLASSADERTSRLTPPRQLTRARSMITCAHDPTLRPSGRRDARPGTARTQLFIHTHLSLRERQPLLSLRTGNRGCVGPNNPAASPDGPRAGQP
jgi:hypothetical protein